MDKKRILLVDDEEDLVVTISMRLEANNYDVIPAYDGQEGLKKAREEKPDLIILDIMMPKLDGYQVCRMLKFDRTLNKIPIIMLTAMSQEEDKKTGMDVKADAYITKPFDSKVLIDKVKELLAE